MARLAYALLLLRFTEAALPTYIMEELYGDECWPKKAQTRKERENCFKAAQAGIRECETCNEAKGGRCTRFAEVTPATTTFTPRHGHASVVFPYRADADSPAELAIYVVGCVEIKILRSVRVESSTRPPRHGHDACSTVWRCRFLTARPSQVGRVIAEK